MLSRELILDAIERFADGHVVHPVAALSDGGYPPAFIDPLAETYCDDPDEPAKTLRNATTFKRLGQLRGVHDLDALHAIAIQVGADLSSVKAFGSGVRARQYANAILQTVIREGGK